MTMGNKIIGYWRKRSTNVDSVGQAWCEYECSECGCITLIPTREECPVCKAKMGGIK